jgi:hypothetical protein
LGASFIDPYGSVRFFALSQTFCPFVHRGMFGEWFYAALLSAWVAIIRLSISFLTRCSARGLSDPSPCTGVAGGSRPINSWLGASPVVALAMLLYTKVAIARRVLHSLSFPATNQGYCSSHWFLHSVSPSVCRRYAVDMFHVMPSSLARVRPKWLMKRGSLSDITFVGSPNQGYTC